MLNALEHGVDVGVGVDDAQQPRVLVVLDERLGLRLEHLEPLADDFLAVVGPLYQPMLVAAFVAMRERLPPAPCRC